MFSLRKKLEMPAAGDALPGRPTPIPTAKDHYVNGLPLKGPYPQGLETATFGIGHRCRRSEVVHQRRPPLDAAVREVQGPS